MGVNTIVKDGNSTNTKYKQILKKSFEDYNLRQMPKIQLDTSVLLVFILIKKEMSCIQKEKLFMMVLLIEPQKDEAKGTQSTKLSYYYRVLYSCE